VLLHLLQELDNDIVGRADEDLALATLLSVGHGLEAIGKDRNANHFKRETKERGVSRSEASRGRGLVGDKSAGDTWPS
jgi:hypothetical protein